MFQQPGGTDLPSFGHFKKILFALLLTVVKVEEERILLVLLLCDLVVHL